MFRFSTTFDSSNMQDLQINKMSWLGLKLGSGHFFCKMLWPWSIWRGRLCSIWGDKEMGVKRRAAFVTWSYESDWEHHTFSAGYDTQLVEQPKWPGSSLDSSENVLDNHHKVQKWKWLLCLGQSCCKLLICPLQWDFDLIFFIE